MENTERPIRWLAFVKQGHLCFNLLGIYGFNANEESKMFESSGEVGVRMELYNTRELKKNCTD